MAHFAEIENGLVVNVIVVGDEYENIFTEMMSEKGKIFIQTSYNNNIRKNFAGVGYSYDISRDAFISPKCHDVAILNEENCRWTCEDPEHKIKPDEA